MNRFTLDLNGMDSAIRNDTEAPGIPIYDIKNPDSTLENLVITFARQPTPEEEARAYTLAAQFFTEPEPTS